MRNRAPENREAVPLDFGLTGSAGLFWPEMRDMGAGFRRGSIGAVIPAERAGAALKLEERADDG